MTVAGSTSGAAAAVAIAEAIKASGTIVRVEPAAFLSVLERSETPLVVMAEGGLIKKNHQYLSSYKGLAFFCKTDRPLELPGDAEVVIAQKIWIPG
jgi:hypothetical protein